MPIRNKQYKYIIFSEEANKNIGEVLSPYLNALLLDQIRLLKKYGIHTLKALLEKSPYDILRILGTSSKDLIIAFNNLGYVFKDQFNDLPLHVLNMDISYLHLTDATTRNLRKCSYTKIGDFLNRDSNELLNDGIKAPSIKKIDYALNNYGLHLVKDNGSLEDLLEREKNGYFSLDILFDTLGEVPDELLNILLKNNITTIEEFESRGISVILSLDLTKEEKEKLITRFEWYGLTFGGRPINTHREYRNLKLKLNESVCKREILRNNIILANKKIEELNKRIDELLYGKSK